MKIENGELYYENLNNVDPQMIGNEYLESVREMVSKGREKRKNKSQDLSMEASVKKKKVDYLEWLK